MADDNYAKNSDTNFSIYCHSECLLMTNKVKKVQSSVTVAYLPFPLFLAVHYHLMKAA